jgi:hypothetical protein
LAAVTAASPKISGSAMWWSAASISTTPFGSWRSHIGRRRGHGRRAVTRFRLDQDGDPGVDLGGLLDHELDHGFTGDDDDLGHAGNVLHPQHRLLERGTLADELQELLGLVAPRSRPKTRA